MNTKMNEKMIDPELGQEKSLVGTLQLSSDSGDIPSQVESDVSSDEPSLRTITPPSSDDRMHNKWLLGVGFVAMLLLGASIMLISHSNRNKFFFEFQSFARGFHDVSKINLDNIIGHLKTLSVSVTSESAQYKSTPNITLHNLDHRAQEIANFSGIEMVLYIPLVDASLRSDWESYAIQNQGWIAKDYKYRGWNASNIKRIREQIYDCDFNFTSLPDDEHANAIAKDETYIRDALPMLGYANGRPMAPISQFGPAVVDPSLVMMDLFSHPMFGKEMVASMKYKHTALSKPMDLSLFFRFHCTSNELLSEHKTQLHSPPCEKGFPKGFGSNGFPHGNCVLGGSVQIETTLERKWARCSGEECMWR
mmetsp:Transcript_41900/g.100953  ORF Transcript_41900/g.100953 Transcript_41900/m.100953 type:complete len:364 (+) Transcript_41900:48-1139(+)